MQAIYSYLKKDGEATLNQAEKELYFSINKAYDLYHLLLLIPIELQNIAERKLEQARQKRLATESDLNPNMRFVNNRVIHLLRINNQLLRYVEQHKLNWAHVPEVPKKLYKEMINSEDYTNYMENGEDSLENDKKFIVALYKNIIAQHHGLYDTLEEESIYWNDESEFIISIIMKTVKAFTAKSDEETTLAKLYKNKDDEDFPKQLIRKTVLNRKEYNELIEEFCKNWDFDRIAFMDILLMQMAIAEVLEFPSIPTKVTFNEYIELSKYYSTSKSNVFINGLLDKVFKHLSDEKKIVKQGRGLMQ